MNRQLYRLTAIAAVLVLVSSSALSSEMPQGVSPAVNIQDLLNSHKAWPVPPASIQITGRSTHGDVSEPIRITATQNEDALVEYGAKKQVFTASRRFEDDGTTLKFGPTRSGFAQLDITNVFLLAQLTGRGLIHSSPQPDTLDGAPVQKIRLTGSRSEMHYRQYAVRDELIVYFDGTGLLAGVSRNFYDTSPLLAFTLAFTFSDYRDTGGVLLPYRIHRYIKGQKVETIAVDRYELDVPVSPTLFEPRRTQ